MRSKETNLKPQTPVVLSENRRRNKHHSIRITHSLKIPAKSPGAKGSLPADSSCSRCKPAAYRYILYTLSKVPAREQKAQNIKLDAFMAAEYASALTAFASFVARAASARELHSAIFRRITRAPICDVSADGEELDAATMMMGKHKPRALSRCALSFAIANVYYP